MWGWTLNWGEVRQDLVIGSCPIELADLERIRTETGATALLSLQTDACRTWVGADYAAHRRHAEAVGLVLENTPMNDFDPADQRRRLPVAVARLQALLVARHRVYVHCTAGINRAPLTVLGYLGLAEGWDTAEALATIFRGRPQAEPYREAYDGCRADLVERLRDLIDARAARHTARGKALAWRQAETEVIREAFTRPGSTAGERIPR
jgi:atypical dual specificity phosphatase